jgi:hypothetical protein
VVFDFVAAARGSETLDCHAEEIRKRGDEGGGVDEGGGQVLQEWRGG